MRLSLLIVVLSLGGVLAPTALGGGSIVYAGDLMRTPATGVIDLSTGARPHRANLSVRTKISGSLPVESPDGRHLAWVSAETLYVANPDGLERRALGPAHSIVTWSPDSRRLATYARQPLDEVTVVDVATGSRHGLGFGANPAWSPDGHWVAFNDPEGVAIAHPDSSQRHIVYRASLTTWEDIDPPAWSPDSHRLAVSLTDFVYSGPADGPGLIVVDLRAPHVWRIYERARHPEWSPAGTTLLYVSIAHVGARLKRVRLFNALTHRTQLVATLPAAEECERHPPYATMAFRASFSPRGDRIAFAYARRRHGFCQTVVGTVRPDGSRMRILDVEPLGTRPAAFGSEVSDAGPRWQKHGTILELAIQRKSKNLDLYLRNEAWTNVRQLTATAENEHDPRFSRDGRWIVFVRGRYDTDGQIWICDTHGRHLRRIAAGQYPSWSPGGDRIVFSRDGAILTVDRRGRDEVRLVAGRGADMPSWSPDGATVAFAKQVPRLSGGDPPHTDGIWSYDIAARAEHRLTDDGLYPRYSPDGHTLAYALWTVGASTYDQLKNEEVGVLRLLASDGTPIDLGDPFIQTEKYAWSPDGNHVIRSFGSGTRIAGPLVGRPPGVSAPDKPVLDPLGIAELTRDSDWSPYSR